MSDTFHRFLTMLGHAAINGFIEENSCLPKESTQFEDPTIDWWAVDRRLAIMPQIQHAT